MICYIDIHTHHPTGLYLEPQGVGIHPWDAESQVPSKEIFDGATLIGEIGLDFTKDVNRAVQEQVFRYQLSQAEKRDVPVVLHCVKAFEPIMKILGEYELRAVIFHGFIGSAEQAERAIKEGYYLSFGHNVSRSPKSIKALNICPLNRLFVETDDSDMTIEDTYAIIAKLRDVEVASMATQIEENYNRIFSK